MSVNVRSPLFYRLNLAIVRDVDPARLAERRAMVVVNALDNAERRLGAPPVSVVADATMMLNLDVLEQAGLELRRVARPRGDLLTVDLLTKERNGGAVVQQGKLL